jgi:C-terminal processing protease CtpA/Prc
MILATISTVLLIVAVSAQSPSPPLEPAAIETAVRSVATVFANEYFDIPLSQTVAAEINMRAAAGRYSAAGTSEALARQLTADLFELTNDKHVMVAVARPRTAGGSGAARRDVPSTAGFKRSEIIPGNIGVLEMTFFLRAIEHRDALAAAMRVLEPADALILDMRENGGGSPETVALLISYLLDRPATPLFDIVRRDGSKDSYRSEATPLPSRNARRPIYVLTSSRTFSAGEGLPFLLQELARAVVIGEPTAGAANPGRPYPAGSLFEITVPNAQVVTAIRRANWEGRGVTPDVAVPAAAAFRIAHLRAIDDLIAAAASPARREALDSSSRPSLARIIPAAEVIREGLSRRLTRRPVGGRC